MLCIPSSYSVIRQFNISWRCGRRLADQSAGELQRQAGEELPKLAVDNYGEVMFGNIRYWPHARKQVDSRGLSFYISLPCD